MNITDTPDGRTRMEHAKDAARAFADAVNMDITKVGIVYFDTNAKPAHVLSRDAASVKAAITAIPAPLGQTHMGKAVIEARNQLTGPRHNPGAQQVMIFMSDGDNTGPPNPVTEAVAAKALGIRIITIGLGEDVSDSTLRDMASSPTDYHFAPSAQGNRILGGCKEPE